MSDQLLQQHENEVQQMRELPVGGGRGGGVTAPMVDSGMSQFWIAHYKVTNKQDNPHGRFRI